MYEITKLALTLMNMTLGLFFRKIIALQLLLKCTPKWCLLLGRGETDIHLIAFYFCQSQPLITLYTAR